MPDALTVRSPSARVTLFLAASAACILKSANHRKLSDTPDHSAWLLSARGGSSSEAPTPHTPTTVEDVAELVLSIPTRLRALPLSCAGQRRTRYGGPSRGRAIP